MLSGKMRREERLLIPEKCLEFVSWKVVTDEVETFPRREEGAYRIFTFQMLTALFDNTDKRVKESDA